jgi:hypothetical protein
MLPPTLSAAEAAAVRAFMAAARALLGGDLLDARLFGSRARGEGDAGSRGRLTSRACRCDGGKPPPECGG